MPTEFISHDDPLPRLSAESLTVTAEWQWDAQGDDDLWHARDG